MADIEQMLDGDTQPHDEVAGTPPATDLVVHSESPITQPETDSGDLYLIVASVRFIRGEAGSEESIPPNTPFLVNATELKQLEKRHRPATEAEHAAFGKSGKVADLGAFAAFDGDGDGRPGGSKPGRRRRERPE